MVLALLALATVGKKEAAAVDRIRLGLVNFEGEATNIWALDRGYFADEELAVAPRVNDSGWDSLQQLIDGDLDLVTAEPTPVIFAALHRDGLQADFAIVASILEGTSLNHLVIANGRGIDKVEHLEGRRIGLSRGTSSEYFWDVIALDHGVATSTVEVVDMPVPQLGAALAAGRIDAAVAWTPYAQRMADRLPEGARIVEADHLYTTSWLVVASRSLLRRDQASIKAYLRAFLRAEEDILAMLGAAARVHAAQTGSAAALLRKRYRTIEFELGLDEALLVNLAQQGQWAIRRGDGMGPPPDVRDLLAPGPLMAVRPGAVDLFD